MLQLLSRAAKADRSKGKNMQKEYSPSQTSTPRPAFFGAAAIEASCLSLPTPSERRDLLVLTFGTSFGIVKMGYIGVSSKM